VIAQCSTTGEPRVTAGIGEPSSAALNDGWSIASGSRASVRASLLPNGSRGAYGGPSGGASADPTFRGHTSWEMRRQTVFVIELAAGLLTLRKIRS
jgi:hypothetical protein